MVAVVLVLQWSHESSLPVSMTMDMFCGGVPTVMEIVRLTLWWKRSLLGGLGRYPDGITCDFSGKAKVLASQWLLKKMPMGASMMKKMMNLRYGMVGVALGLIMVFFNGFGFWFRGS